MNGTILRTILVVATCLNTALLSTDLSGFDNPTLDLVYRIASIVLNFVIVGISTYYNNDYTDTAREYTGMMRYAKEIESDQFIGEEYTEPLEDDSEEVANND